MLRHYSLTDVEKQKSEAATSLIDA